MSVPYDPYRQRQREAVRQAPVTVRNAPGGPRQEPARPEPERDPEPARERTQERVPSLRERLRALDRDDLVELAGRYGLDTYRVKSTHLIDQLADMSVAPDDPPSGGMTGVVGPQ